MKTLLTLLIAILTASLIFLMSGCGRVTVRTEDDNGRNWNITSYTFGKRLEGVTATIGDVEFSLGSSSIDIPTQNEVIACLLAPKLCE